jgi:hypothetical protein
VDSNRRPKDFKTFYCGTDGALFREFFPKMTCYSPFLRRLPLAGEILTKFLQSRSGKGFFIVDSTSFQLCENVRFRQMHLFPNFAGWAYSSTRCVHGFKLHLAMDETGKIVAFRLTKGNRHGIKEAENLLRCRTGCLIWQGPSKAGRATSGFLSSKFGGSEAVPSVGAEPLYALTGQGGKLKGHIGDRFSRFRAWGAVQATITLGVLTLNLGY